ncbi:MAG: VCBS repeat-containing protein [Verrucomicrobiota bacterium]
MKTTLLSFAVASGTVVSSSGADYLLHTFKKTQLTDKFWCEGATFGDLNRDGKPDIVSGPYWYEGPDFTKRHEYYPATTTFKLKTADGTEQTIEGFEGALGVNNKYSDNFFAFVQDFNGDHWNDILIIGFPGEGTAWFENPKGQEGPWKKHVVLETTDNESPTFTDITGDKKPELVCSSKGVYGYAEPDWKNPTAPWKFHPISPDNKYQRFTHGMGVGDVNGDGRLDLLEKSGWWEQPKSLAGDPVWTYHPFEFTPIGGAQMYAYDVNGDGLNDVITSYAAHGFGLVWYEQVRAGGEITFKQHVILSPEQKRLPDKYGVCFTELHAIDLVDMDSDGLKDIVTGKRFWSHGHEGDPDRNDNAVLYWFKLVRGPGHTAEFVPHLIDDSSGVGTQVVAARVSNKTFPDVVVGNKRGTFYLQHSAKKVSKAEWQAAQPKLANP